MRKIFGCLILLLVCIYGCKNNEPVKFINVYKSSLLSGSDTLRKSSSSRDEFYYVYNYNDTNLKQLIRMLDTLNPDTSYQFYNYRFLKYDSNLPDTAKLKKKMALGSDDEPIENPGSSKFYKYQILDFMFIRHYTSEGKSFPDSYTLTLNDKGNIYNRSKYFLRDSITKKLIEVGQYTVSPAPVR